MDKVGDFNQVVRIKIDQPADEVIQLGRFWMVNILIRMVRHCGANLGIAEFSHDDAYLIFGQVKPFAYCFGGPRPDRWPFQQQDCFEVGNRRDGQNEIPQIIRKFVFDHI